MTSSNHQSALSKKQIDSVIELYSSGQYQEAIDQINFLNTSYPNVPFLFNLVGACYKALGQQEVAVRMFEKAVGIKSDYAEAHKNLGITLKDLGKLDAAIKSLKQSIAIDSNYVDAYYNLAIILKSLGQLDEAIQCYEKAITLNPNFADAHNNLGNVFKELKQLDNAVKSYKRAIEIKPNFAEAHNNLGNVFKDLKQLENAVKSYKRAKEINPKLSEVHYNLGVALKQLRLLDDAVISLKNAITIKSDYAEAHNNLGSCFTLLGQMDLAIECYEQALSINPNYAEAHNSLGNVLIIIGQVKDGVKCFEKAIEIKPDFAEAHNSLGNVFKKLKQRDKALLYYERAFAIKPDMDFLFGTLLNHKMNLCIWDDFSSQLKELRDRINNNEKVIGPFNLMGLIDDPALHRKASEIFTNYHYPKNYTLCEITPYPKHKKIRIGYFSGDFKIHPVAYLTAELYEVHDRNQFEIHAFSLSKDSKDYMNLRIKSGVDHFHDVFNKSDQEVALLARSFEIDIAVDLGGFSGNSRPRVFAMSAAPIQLTYMFLGTMGADYYDYLIADPIMIPKKNHKHFLEKIVYLPSYLVNDSTELPPKVTLTRKELGLPEEGFVFCCFNNSYKFTPDVFDSWARILQSVGGSVLIVYANNELSKTNLTKEIIRRRIDPSRLIFGGNMPRPEYLARYRVADLFLDTRPFNAGTTASDALRMGLPVLTCTGNSFSSMEASGIIRALNLPELITSSPEEYEALAIELATNPDKLKIIKEKLLDNFSTAPLYDTSMFTKNLEFAFTEIYERYHQGLEPDHIYAEV